MPAALCFDLFILTVCASTRWSRCEACDWGCSPKHQTSRLSPAMFLFTFLTIKGAVPLRPSSEMTCQTMKSCGLPLSPQGISAPDNTLITKGSTAPPQFLNSLILPSLSYFPKIWTWISNRCQRRKLKKDRYSYCCLGFGILRIHQTKRICL